nr:protein FAM136A-like [Ipomoea batatas]GME07919.1 protein FAM136A-like [Ipomoea batatas]
MEPIAAEERIVTERLRRKLDEVNKSVQNHFSGIEDHVNFTLQQAYFKCAYECFDRKKKPEEIGSCVEYCSVPVVNAQNVVQNEISQFQVNPLTFLYYYCSVS